MCAAVLGAWLGKSAHTHVKRLRAIADWQPWGNHYGITQYIGHTMRLMWHLREQWGLHLLQKSFVTLEILRERLRAYEDGKPFTDRLGCLRERFFGGTGFVFSR